MVLQNVFIGLTSLSTTRVPFELKPKHSARKIMTLVPVCMQRRSSKIAGRKVCFCTFLTPTVFLYYYTCISMTITNS
ncbi:hypothetical protein C5167_021543 [Papaver somniferum]|nr:hypothetical protein C5167_021543 [Papaver somniferum]